jgi:hypothetical protein
MAIKRITLTEDHLRLISNIKFEKFVLNDSAWSERFAWGIDQWNLFGGTYVLEDISMIIGKYGEAIEIDGANGPKFNKELEDYMWEIYEYIVDNLTFIMDLVLKFSSKGGLKVGTYKCIDYELNWEFLG